MRKARDFKIVTRNFLNEPLLIGRMSSLSARSFRFFRALVEIKIIETKIPTIEQIDNRNNIGIYWTPFHPCNSGLGNRRPINIIIKMLNINVSVSATVTRIGISNNRVELFCCVSIYCLSWLFDYISLCHVFPLSFRKIYIAIKFIRNLISRSGSRIFFRPRLSLG